MSLDVKPIKINNEFEQGIINQSALIPNKVRRTCIVGSSGSGKTYFATSILPMMYHKPHKVFIFGKTDEELQPGYMTLRCHCEDNDIPFEVSQEITTDHIKELLCDDLVKYVIIDDYVGKTEDRDDLIKLLYMRGRNHHVYPVCISQDFTNINKAIRNSITNWVIYPLENPLVMRSNLGAFKSIIPADRLEMAREFIQSNPYSCLFLQRDGDNVIITGDNPPKVVDIKTGYPLDLSKRKKDKDKLIKKRSKRQKEYESD